MNLRLPVLAAVALLCALTAPSAVASSSHAPDQASEPPALDTEEAPGAEPVIDDGDPGLEDGEYHMGWSARLFEEEPPQAARSAIAPMSMPVPPGVPGSDGPGGQGRGDRGAPWDLGRRVACR